MEIILPNFAVKDFSLVVNIVLVLIFLLLSGVIIATIVHARKMAIVRENSTYYKNVLTLNANTQYFCDLPKDGYCRFDLSADTKREFDKLDYRSTLQCLLREYSDEIALLLVYVQENRRVYNSYCNEFDTFTSTISPEECKTLRIKYDTFIELETSLVSDAKIEMVRELSVACELDYTSPKGRNRYVKEFTFLESEIRSAIREISEIEAWQRTETYRRKNERSKVTPSLRYDVMHRDGFRCRLCGRSADSGVELEVDHIVPVSKGGSTTYNNLQTLCRDCNRGKGAKM